MNKKVILISIDGMRPDGLKQCGNPYVKDLEKICSYTYNGASCFPSVTFPCHFSMAHSVIPQRHGLLTNTYVPQVRPIKGIFEVIEQCPKYIEKEFDFGQSQGKYSSKWKVRLIKKGMPFGNNPSRINDGKSVLEFYDISGDKDKFPSGQYVCSYYMETIMEHKGLLKLYADVEPWTITGPNMIKIQNWAFDIS